MANTIIVTCPSSELDLALEKYVFTYTHTESQPYASNKMLYMYIETDTLYNIVCYQDCESDYRMCLTEQDLIYLLDDRRESVNKGNFLKVSARLVQ
jgi:hypothetical protein